MIYLDVENDARCTLRQIIDCMREAHTPEAEIRRVYAIFRLLQVGEAAKLHFTTYCVTEYRRVE